MNALQQIKQLDYEAINLYGGEYECNLEAISEYYADAVNTVNSYLKSNAIRYREVYSVETIKWGGTNTYKVFYPNTPIKVKGTDYVIMQDDIEHYISIDVYDYASEIKSFFVGDNKISFDEIDVVTEIEFDIDVLLDKIPSSRIYINKHGFNNLHEDMLLIMDENNIIQNYEELKEKQMRELCANDENYMSVEEVVKRLENLSEFYGTLSEAKDFLTEIYRTVDSLSERLFKKECEKERIEREKALKARRKEIDRQYRELSGGEITDIIQKWVNDGKKHPAPRVIVEAKHSSGKSWKDFLGFYGFEKQNTGKTINDR